MAVVTPSVTWSLQSIGTPQLEVNSLQSLVEGGGGLKDNTGTQVVPVVELGQGTAPQLVDCVSGAVLVSWRK